MAEIAELWAASVGDVRQAVTGVGVWTALKCAKPVALEDGVFVLGLEPREGELAGHLRLPQHARLIENVVSKKLGSPVKLRVIDGTGAADWERAKRRDAEAARLRQQADNRAQAEQLSKVSWDSVYEQLGRKYAAIPAKSLPQNRAKFLAEAIDLVVETRKRQTERDDLNERNFARCLERVAQYAEMPSTIVALEVLRRVDEL